MNDEQHKIADHNSDKIKAIKTRLSIEMLSFLGITIGFSLSLFNTYRSYKNLQNELNGVS
jgi:hypothetical protein